MRKENKNYTLVLKIFTAVILGLLVGFIFILIRNKLGGNINSSWRIIDAILFQDITISSGFNGIGIFYIIGQLFMRGLQLAIVPLVFTSLSLAICSLADSKKIELIAVKTFLTYIIFYIIVAFLAGASAFLVMKRGGFNVVLPKSEATKIATMNGFNPLVTIINAVPNNIFSVFSSNNQVLSVVVVAIITGLCMTKLKDKAKALKKVIESLFDVLQVYLNFLISKISPIAIFCMISRALAIYGTEYIKPTFVWMLTTIIVSLVLVITVYPLGIFLTTGLNPIIFIKKTMKVGFFAAATNSSAATLPINTKTCINELGCSEEISSFILPTGMTVNMNGTTAMHMIAIVFIATAAGIKVTPGMLVLVAFLSICTAMGTPAIPIAGTTMVYVVMSGIGLNSELCLIGYSLVLAMNYLPGMAVITLNVIGDAATNVIINYKEGVLNEEIYNS
ncbi:MAG: dicarboxylate/amino acid:cation symporter [Pleomorphochaeta sp.]